MIRANLLALTFAVALAVPALAASGHAFTAQQARQHLARLGYTNISDLQRDTHGNWAGIAFKDGRAVPVAVGVKPGAQAN